MAATKPIAHRPYIIHPGGRIEELQPTYPVGKLRAGRLYCKYCYTTHADWHLMRKEDYGAENKNTIILCGRCEYTSKLMLIDNVNESKRALQIIKDEPAVDCGPFGLIGFDKEHGDVRPLNGEVVQ